MPSDRSTITGWMQPEQIILNAEIADRSQALRFMAAAIGSAHGLDPAPIERALERRERAVSTALGDGFAIPHARVAGLDRPLTLFVRTASAIEFDAPDGKPVSDLLAILVPADGDKDDHLQLLALIARLFSNREFRAGLDKAPDVATASSHFRAGVARVEGLRA